MLRVKSLAQMTNAYQRTVGLIATTLFGRGDVIVVAIFALVPALPLPFTQGPANEVVKRLAGLLLGGMP